MFRDDLQAAIARITALEHELAEMQRERAGLQTECERLRAALETRERVDANLHAPVAAAPNRDLNYCAACGAANAAGQQRCEICDELLADASGGQGARACPCCRDEGLQIVGLGAAQVSCCRGCGGVWLTTKQLPPLLAAAKARRLGFEPEELDMLWDGRQRASRTSPRRAGGTRPSYLRCPECEEMMLRRAHSGARVVVDVCVGHGVWLDRGELPQVLGAARLGDTQSPFERPKLTASGPGLLAGPSRGEAALDWLGNLLITKVRTRGLW